MPLLYVKDENLDRLLCLIDDPEEKVMETIGKWFVEGAGKPLISVIEYVDA